MKRYTRDAEQKKELIFNAFTELANEVGYERLTTRNIAKRARVSIGTVYHHFKEGKAAIAAGLFERNLSLQMGYLKEDFRTQITRHLELHREYKELYRAFDQAIYAREDIFRGIKQKRDEVISEALEDSEVSFEVFSRINATLEAIIHRHLFIEPMFEKDGELIEYLVAMLEASYSYNR
jgi:AcrR family transcriptional regulator